MFTLPSFLGACRTCGGPQVWTIVHGEVWVACRDGSHDQLEIFGLPTLNVKEGEELDDVHWEPPQECGVVPPESGDAIDKGRPGTEEEEGGPSAHPSTMQFPT